MSRLERPLKIDPVYGIPQSGKSWLAKTDKRNLKKGFDMGNIWQAFLRSGDPRFFARFI
jgi:predicted AAA+ superfamily ATPase